jgi:hypothetical protein
MRKAERGRLSLMFALAAAAFAAGRGRVRAGGDRRIARDG